MGDVADSAVAVRAPERRRRADIQGMRAVAVLLVVAFHAGLPVSGGYVGVDVFFVISGLVITTTMLSELEGTDRLSFSTFYSRRARRLLPALAALLAVVALVSLFALSPLGTQRSASMTGLASSLFSANIELSRGVLGYFDAPADTNPLLHMWSLAVEEQFYLVFPAAIALAWRFARRHRARVSPRVTTGALLLVAACASFAYGVFAIGQDAGDAFYSSPARAWEFAVGALLALAAPAVARLRPIYALVMGPVGLALIAAAAIVDDGRTLFPGTAALVPVLGAALVLAAGTAREGLLTSILGSRVGVWIGDRSYAFYLWHWPAVVFVRLLWPGQGWAVPVAAALSILPAWASYELLEQPIRRNPKYSGRAAVRLAAKCIALPVLTWLLVWGLVSPSLATQRVSHVRTQWRLHGGPRPFCLTRVANPPVQQRCNRIGPTTNPQGAFALVGDSNAQQFIEPATRAAVTTNMDLLVAWRQGCPFADVEAISDTSSPLGLLACRTFVRNTIDRLKELRPKVVVLAAASSEYILLERLTLRRNGVTGRTPESKAQLWADGLRSVVRELSDAGIAALVVHPIPNFAHFDGNKCPAVRLYLDAKTCGESLTRAQVAEQQELPFGAERDAIRDVPLASAVDFTPLLCHATRCSTNEADQWRYRDGAHLSVPGALLLTERFADALT